MGKIKDFYHLDTWKKSHQFVLTVYKITKKFPKEEKYALTDQIKRASSSVTANIAEGFGRFHYKDKAKFYHQARSSLKEVQNFLILSKDLNYISESQAKKLWNKSKTCERLINGLIRATKK